MSGDSYIVIFTGVLALSTVILAASTIGLWIYTAIGAKAAKRAADVNFVASMPVLSPHIVPQLTRLHPLEPVDTFDSRISFVFENFGKTPALIRKVRADLFLNEQDTFPTVDFEKLPIIKYEPIVAGEARGENALMGVAEYKKEFGLTKKEFEELLTDATTDRYRRFAFVGEVVYDDFFGMRHTRRFCVKMRFWGNNQFFQLVRGGPALNRVTRARIPAAERT